MQNGQRNLVQQNFRFHFRSQVMAGFVFPYVTRGNPFKCNVCRSRATLYVMRRAQFGRPLPHIKVTALSTVGYSKTGVQPYIFFLLSESVMITWANNAARGGAQSTVCSPCVYQCCPQYWRGFGEAFWSSGLPAGPIVCMTLVTFDLCHAPPILSQAHPKPSLSVNDPLRAGSDWRIACLHVMVWWLCGGSVAPPTQEVGHAIVLGVWWDVTCAFRCCQGCAVLVAMFVDFQWSVKFSLRVSILEEQDSVILGVLWRVFWITLHVSQLRQGFWSRVTTS